MMFWEIIATILAGFVFAGLALSARLIFKKIPKWIIPAMAGLGMITYQIVTEYTWFSHTTSNLPEGSVVVASVPKTTFFRPWSYIKPQIFQFVVLDSTHIAPTKIDGIYQARLYFFERRLPAQELLTVFDCYNARQAHIFNEQNPNLNQLDWQTLEYTPKALKVICQ